MTDPTRACPPPEIVVIGAGPAGLTAAHELVRRGHTSTVLEADTVVGGIARTVERDGWRFDIGGHRFFTKVTPVEARWEEILPGDDFMTRPRLSRIYYRNRFFDYPLKATNALRNLGVVEAGLCVGSYLWARLRPPRDQSTFEGWVAARFGWRLYRIFFRTYTEKVWGVPASSIRADWAAQRIRNLSLGKAIAGALLPRRDRTAVASLIDEFRYPKLGPGMMWERCRELVEAAGTKVIMDAAVVAVEHEAGRATTVVARTGDSVTRFPADHVISSMPINELVAAMEPAPPPDVLAAASALEHRDFLTVALVVPEELAFPDNWIYVHAPDVRVGRVQNFGAWSPHMVRDGRTCLGLEYFVTEGDDLWAAPDDGLIELATAELARLALVPAGSVESGYVVRMPKAYPVYDADYAANVDTLRAWLAGHAANVHPVGRNGMHRYNNQDHSMYTAMLTVENIVAGSNHDVWSVNVEEDYLEERTGEQDGPPPSTGTGRSAPVPVSRTSNSTH
ncbi:MAG: NAD(P)/FAD-dependent oxidoreductase [Acidimicrobiales bacterium]